MPFCRSLVWGHQTQALSPAESLASCRWIGSYIYLLVNHFHVEFVLQSDTFIFRRTWFWTFKGESLRSYRSSGLWRRILRLDDTRLLILLLLILYLEVYYLLSLITNCAYLSSILPWASARLLCTQLVGWAEVTGTHASSQEYVWPTSTTPLSLLWWYVISRLIDRERLTYLLAFKFQLIARTFPACFLAAQGFINQMSDMLVVLVVECYSLIWPLETLFNSIGEMVAICMSYWHRSVNLDINRLTFLMLYHHLGLGRPPCRVLRLLLISRLVCSFSSSWLPYRWAFLSNSDLLQVLIDL